MSLSTTCYTYFTDTSDNVSSNSSDQASCDSSYVDCTVTASDGSSVALVCDSTLHTNPIGADFTAIEYFCVCDGGVALSVPSIVTCASLCYDLSTPERCNFLTLYDGATQGNTDLSIQHDDCDNYSCDTTNGPICTTDNTTAYQCDNAEHGLSQSSTQSYVCNCFGPAAVPSIFQSNGQTVGTACGNAGQATATSAPTAAASATSGAGSAGSSTTSAGDGSQTTIGSSNAKTGAAQRNIIKRVLLGICFLPLLGMHA